MANLNTGIMFLVFTCIHFFSVGCFTMVVRVCPKSKSISYIHLKSEKVCATEFVINTWFAILQTLLISSYYYIYKTSVIYLTAVISILIFQILCSLNSRAMNVYAVT